MRRITECGISGGEDFHSLWKLPEFPLTERFGPFNPNQGLAFDQQLIISLPAGHVQLQNQLDPRVLYSSTDYKFRTGNSQRSRKDVDFFRDYLKKITSNRRFKSVVDVGGNDLFTMRALADIADNRAVIDPICVSQHGQTLDGVKVLGRFAEEVDYASDIAPPDLLICRHTLEHFACPHAVVSQWFQQCPSECLFVIEVPCFDNLIESFRFDAVFHQHLHYFDLYSLKYLIWQCGGEYLNHTVNYQGSCGGTLILAFRKAAKKQPAPTTDLRNRISRIEKQILLYETQMVLMKQQLENLPKPVFGYGASVMLASLAYHLETDFSFLECILDDNPVLDGLSYENVRVKVKHTEKVTPRADSSYLITSLENIRVIYQRIVNLSPRRILTPFIT